MPVTPFIGQIMGFGATFAPIGWAFCDGQLLAISGNEALFSILGTIYGGDGRTTFGLPDIRGRVAIHWGTGPGLPTVIIGQKVGVENVGLTTSNLPSHTHTATATPQPLVNATANDGNQDVPSSTNRLSAGKLSGGIDVLLYNAGGTDTTLGGFAVSGAMSVANTGSGSTHNNMQPWLGLRYCIALVGIFPSRP